jgi:hypothetical protein
MGAGHAAALVAAPALGAVSAIPASSSAGAAAAINLRGKMGT